MIFFFFFNLARCSFIFCLGSKRPLTCESDDDVSEEMVKRNTVWLLVETPMYFPFETNPIQSLPNRRIPRIEGSCRYPFDPIWTLRETDLEKKTYISCTVTVFVYGSWWGLTMHGTASVLRFKEPSVLKSASLHQFTNHPEKTQSQMWDVSLLLRRRIPENLTYRHWWTESGIAQSFVSKHTVVKERLQAEHGKLQGISLLQHVVHFFGYAFKVTSSWGKCISKKVWELVKGCFFVFFWVVHEINNNNHNGNNNNNNNDDNDNDNDDTDNNRIIVVLVSNIVPTFTA